MNAIQKLQMAKALQKAMESEDMAKLCKLTGLDDPMFDAMPVNELMETLAVRITNLLIEIGAIDERQN